MKLPPTHPKPISSIAGFTLVEVLVVAAIIGILVAILIPVVGHARAAAGSATCQANLHAIGQAALLWGQDNKGRIVPVFDPGDSSQLSTANWTGLLAPYLGWQGPSSAKDTFPSFAAMPVYICPERPGIFGYGYNYFNLSWLQNGANGKTQWVYYNAVTNPAKTVMITDSESNAAGKEDTWKAYVRVPNSLTDYTVAFRHPGETANVLWVDGHVSAEHKNSPMFTDPNDYWKAN